MYGADLISKTAGPIICHKAAALGPDRQPLFSLELTFKKYME